MALLSDPTAVPARLMRPPWWTERGIIDWLAANPGATLTSMCELASSQCDRAPKLLHRDLSRLRREFPTVDEALTAHVLNRQGFVQKSSGKTLDERIGPNWRQDFANAILGMETPSYVQAADSIGCHWSHLSKKAKKDSEYYDERWANTLVAIEEELTARCVDNVYWGLNRAREKDDPKTVIQGAISVLERRRKDEWSRQVETRGRVDHVLKIEEGTRVAMEQAAVRSRKLFGNSDAIDVEVIPDGS